MPRGWRRRAAQRAASCRDHHRDYDRGQLDVAFGLSRRGREERHSLTRRTLELVGLQHKASRHPHELSGGERQRVALARARAGEVDRDGQPIEASRLQIGRFRELFEEGNSREAQPLNGRVVRSDAG